MTLFDDGTWEEAEAAFDERVRLHAQFQLALRFHQAAELELVKAEKALAAALKRVEAAKSMAVRAAAVAVDAGRLVCGGIDDAAA